MFSIFGQKWCFNVVRMCPLIQFWGHPKRTNAHFHIHIIELYHAIYMHCVYKVEPCRWVIDGPELHKHTQLMSSEYGLISHEVVKIVDNDSHKEIEELLKH